MRKLSLVVWLGLGLLLVVKSSALADEYTYLDSPDCKLIKLVGPQWIPSDGSDLTGQGFAIQPSKNNPNRSVMRVNGAWFSSESRCLIAKPAEERPPLQPPPPITYLENQDTKVEPSATFRRQSQFQHQTDKGVFELTPNFTYGSLALNLNSIGTSPAKISDSAYALDLQPELGLSQNFSLGGSLGYQNDSLTTTGGTGVVFKNRASGMSDPSFYLNCRAPLSSGLLRIAVPVSFSLTHNTVDAFLHANEASGGIAFSPFIGYEFPAGPGLLGFQFQYTLLGTRTTDTTATNGTVTTSTTTGGNRLGLSAFYEWDLRPWTLGLAFQYVSSAATTTTVAGVANNNNDNGNNIAIQLYAPYEASRQITLLPNFTYLNRKYAPGVPASSTTSSSFASSSSWQLSLGVRFGFF